MRIKNSNRKAFTMIELIFVIVIMGVLGKFGVELLAQAYKGFINSEISNKLQSNSATAIEFVSTRLQHRIKASTIARETDPTIVPQFTPLNSYYSNTANILEWIGSDIEGFRGDSNPFWSGLIDLDTSVTNSTQLTSPQTDTTKINELIKGISNNSADFSSAIIYFKNPDPIDVNWGWDANTSKFDTQLGDPAATNAIHPIRIDTGDSSRFLPAKSDGTANTFSGVRAFEFYQLAWSAYAVGINDYNTSTNTGDLTLWYNYQPWKGDKYTDTNTSSTTIMTNVSSFKFIARESLIKIQVCVKSLLLKDKGKEYSVCKEKTIF